MAVGSHHACCVAHGIKQKLIFIPTFLLISEIRTHDLHSDTQNNNGFGLSLSPAPALLKKMELYKEYRKIEGGIDKEAQN